MTTRINIENTLSQEKLKNSIWGLKLNDEGKSVYYLHFLLKSFGFQVSAFNNDDYIELNKFTNETLNTLRLFQDSNNLEVTGIVDEPTAYFLVYKRLEPKFQTISIEAKNNLTKIVTIGSLLLFFSYPVVRKIIT